MHIYIYIIYIYIYTYQYICYLCDGPVVDVTDLLLSATTSLYGISYAIQLQSFLKVFTNL
jgi:hypothetical protein